MHLPTDLCYTNHGTLAETGNNSMGPPWRINPTTHRTSSERFYHEATSRCCIFILDIHSDSLKLPLKWSRTWAWIQWERAGRDVAQWISAWCSGSSDRSLVVDSLIISCPNHCCTTGVVKAMVSDVLAVVIKNPLLLNRKSSVKSGGSGFPLSLFEWSFIMCAP